MGVGGVSVPQIHPGEPKYPRKGDPGVRVSTHGSRFQFFFFFSWGPNVYFSKFPTFSKQDPLGPMSSWRCVGGMGPHLPPPSSAPSTLPPPPKWEGAGPQEGMKEGFGGQPPQDPQVGLSLGALGGGGGLWVTPPMGSWGGQVHPEHPPSLSWGGRGGAVPELHAPQGPPPVCWSHPPCTPKTPMHPQLAGAPPQPPKPPPVYQTPPFPGVPESRAPEPPQSPEDPHVVLDPPPDPPGSQSPPPHPNTPPVHRNTPLSLPDSVFPGIPTPPV